MPSCTAAQRQGPRRFTHVQAYRITPQLIVGVEANKADSDVRSSHPADGSILAKRGGVVQLPHCRGHCFSILILCPTTAASAQFCLLCCQPEPIPRSLTARMSLFTQRDPCRLAAWLGRTIHMVSRACKLPLPSSTPGQSYRQCPSEIQRVALIDPPFWNSHTSQEVKGV